MFMTIGRGSRRTLVAGDFGGGGGFNVDDSGPRMSRLDFFRRVGLHPGLLVGPVDSLNLSTLGVAIATLGWVL